MPELSGEVAEAIGGGVKTLGAAYGGLSRALTICDPCTPLGSLPEKVLHTCPLQMSGERKKKKPYRLTQAISQDANLTRHQQALGLALL